MIFSIVAGDVLQLIQEGHCNLIQEGHYNLDPSQLMWFFLVLLQVRCRIWYRLGILVYLKVGSYDVLEMLIFLASCS